MKNKFIHLGAVALAATFTGAVAASAAGFIPHRAVYDLSLKEASDRSGINNMTGRIVYELKGSECEGYAARYRFSTKVEIGGKTLVNDQRSTTFESADGKRFDFITQYFLNGQQEQDLRGSASKSDTGITVELKKPDEREVKLDPAIFMNQHLEKIIEAARQKETIYTAKVFDGSDNGDELVDTTTIIGKKKANVGSFEGEPEKLGKKFDNSTGWPVSVSYYKVNNIAGGGEKLPTYQVSFMLHEDGVSRNLTMQYEDYSMKGVLKEITYLKVGECE